MENNKSMQCQNKLYLTWLSGGHLSRTLNSTFTVGYWHFKAKQNGCIINNLHSYYNIKIRHKSPAGVRIGCRIVVLLAMLPISSWRQHTNINNHNNIRPYGILHAHTCYTHHQHNQISTNLLFLELQLWKVLSMLLLYCIGTNCK